MGVIQFGFPKNTVRWLQQHLSLTTFVEGGTFEGNSARAAAAIFERVVTIEKSRALHDAARQVLQPLANVECRHGCTRDHLTSHLSPGERVLFWLDAHWCGGISAGKNDECPLLEELQRINLANLGTHAIFIDDARLFTMPPPPPHDPAQWPRLDQIAKAMPKEMAMYINDDVIMIVPESISSRFSPYLQGTALAKIPAEKDSWLSSGVSRLRTWASRKLQ